MLRARTPSGMGLPSYPRAWTTGAPSSRACERRRHGRRCVCTSAQGFSALTFFASQDGPRRQLHHPRTTPMSHPRTSPANDLLWSTHPCGSYPDLRIVAGRRAGIGWIPFYLDRCRLRHYKHHQGLDSAPRLRREAPERGLPRADHHVLHRRRVRAEEPARHRRRHDHLGVRLPPQRHHLAERAGDPRPLPRRRPGRRDRQDDAPERHEALPVRSVRPHPTRRVHRRRAPQAGGATST